MKKLAKGCLLFVTCSLFSFYFVGCNNNEDGGSTVLSSGAGTYKGPGSEWTVSLTAAGSFTITRAPTAGGTLDMTVTGSFTVLSSGYLKLTVSEATGTASDKPSAGDQAYGMLVPGFAFLLKPMSNAGKIIPMLIAGDCPGSGFNMNWIKTDDQRSGNGTTNYIADAIDMYGTANYDSATTALNIPSRYNLGNASQGAGPAMTGTCTNGVLTTGSSDTLYLTGSGGALVRTSGGDTIVAMPDQTISAVSDLAGNYSGILFNESVDANTQSETEPVWLTIATDGTASAGTWSDVDAGTQGSNAVTMSAFSINTPSNGFVRTTLTETGSGNTAPMQCQVSLNVAGTGKNIIFCVSIDANASNGGDNSMLYNVLLVSR